MQETEEQRLVLFGYSRETRSSHLNISSHACNRCKLNLLARIGNSRQKKFFWGSTSSPGPSARYPRQMALVQANVTGIVSGGSAKILFLFLIAQTGLNNAMRMSIVLKFCEFCCVFTFGFIFTFNFVRNKEKSFE